MKHPLKRKKTERRCPINVNSLCRRWERGDNRIDWPRIEKLYNAWLDGEKVPWRKLSHTFIKKGQRVVRRPRRILARDRLDFGDIYIGMRPTRPRGAPRNPFADLYFTDLERDAP